MLELCTALYNTFATNLSGPHGTLNPKYSFFSELLVGFALGFHDLDLTHDYAGMAVGCLNNPNSSSDRAAGFGASDLGHSICTTIGDMQLLLSWMCMRLPPLIPTKQPLHLTSYFTLRLTCIV